MSILDSLQDLGSLKIDILRDVKPEWGEDEGGGLGAECAGGIVTSRFTFLLTETLTVSLLVLGPTGCVGNSETFTVT